MRVIFFGTLCTFSTTPLRLLIEAGHEIRAVVIQAYRPSGDRPLGPLNPAPPDSIPIADAATSPTIVSLAWQQQLPVYQIHQLSAVETLDTLAQLQADVACVACFPRRIPGALLKLPRWGFLNIHPALLPDYRGPYPLFWMFHHGERHFGVTIHFMDEQLDAGDIVAQAEVDLPDGLSGEEADSTLSQYGAELLLDVLSQLEEGRCQRRAQPAGGRYFSVPQDSDFAIDATWSAQRAFNFMRGTSDWQRSYPIEVAGRRFNLKQGLFYASHEILERPYRLWGNQIDIQFSPGVLRALIE